MKLMRQPWIWIGTAFAVFLFLRFLVFDISVVSGNSMLPGLPRGSIVLALRSPFAPRAEAGDLVMFRTGEDRMVKRLLARGPAMVDWDDTRVRVNGKPVKIHDTAQPVPLPGNTFVGQNMVFLLGDNSRESIDSRSFGPLAEDALTGTVIFAFQPFW